MVVFGPTAKQTLLIYYLNGHRTFAIGEYHTLETLLILDQDYLPQDRSLDEIQQPSALCQIFHLPGQDRGRLGQYCNIAAHPHKGYAKVQVMRHCGGIKG